jgi:D-glycero-D-manno-heptose 1,7-bisphosphate phosphatase
MNGAIIFDRDGVLIENSQHYYVWNQAQLQFVEGIFDNMQKLAAKGYQLFIVSNQGGISKGLYKKEDTEKLHQLILENFRAQGIEISDILYCPHHPSVENCLCRKPNALMIEKLMAKYQLDPTQTFLIGDSTSDMDAAQNAGIRGIKIEANSNMAKQILQLL